MHLRQVFKIDQDEDTERIKKLIADDSYTYNDCIKYVEVMAHHVKSMMKKGEKKTGYPIIDAEKVMFHPTLHNCMMRVRFSLRSNLT